jgi:exodeoxyribonuclease VII large subunit
MKQSSRLDMLEQRLAPALKHRAQNGAFELEQLGQKLRRALVGCAQTRAQALDRAQLRLGLLDPSLVLKRGYAWLSDEHGVPITQVRSLKKGQAIAASLSDGRVALEVSQTPSLT